ncbi:hypothetical protein GLYMA_04G188750v4 [Glycine max]|nr:hypothetical protein GLYMA_04G188750v4 [Glycine max]KAH1112052.1 hypothetical protein GYH30_010410 [Glycine max]
MSNVNCLVLCYLVVVCGWMDKRGPHITSILFLPQFWRDAPDHIFFFSFFSLSRSLLTQVECK